MWEDEGHRCLVSPGQRTAGTDTPGRRGVCRGCVFAAPSCCWVSVPCVVVNVPRQGRVAVLMSQTSLCLRDPGSPRAGVFLAVLLAHGLQLEPVSVPTWGGILPPAEEKERLTLPQWRGVWSRYRQLPASGVPLWPVRGAQGLRLHWCSAGSGHNTVEMSHCPRSSAHRGPMVAKAFVELPGSHDRVPSASCFLTGLRRGGSAFPVCGPPVVSLGIYLSPQDTLAERWPRQREM